MKRHRPWYRRVVLKTLTWLAIGCLRGCALIPYPFALRLGRRLGRLMYRTSKRSRDVAALNLKLCFPEKTPAERQMLLIQNFESAGISMLETAFSWWATSKQLQGLLHLHGIEYLDEALQKGKGVILCSAHFMALELAGRLLASQRPFAVIYRPQKNPVLDQVAKRQRERVYQHVIRRGDLRGLLKCLRSNGAVWYTPDIDAGEKNSLFVPFFGVLAATVTATARLARLSGSPVVPVFPYRRADGSGYDIHFYPALSEFPSKDLYADTLRINQVIEAAIQRAPEQYLWQYKRFKTRPAGEARFYDQLVPKEH